MKFFLALLVLFTVIKRGRPTCAVCDATTNIQCLTSTTYRLCSATTNLPTGSILTCPTGQTCSSTITGGCNAGTTECNCGQCINGFACVSANQFNLCIGSSTTPNGVIQTCPTGTYCESGVLGFCSTTPGGSDCTGIPSGSTACTTTGRFPLTGTLCKSYYNCVIKNNAFVRYDYNCTGSSFFNPVSKQCSTGYVCTE